MARTITLGHVDIYRILFHQCPPALVAMKLCHSCSYSHVIMVGTVSCMHIYIIYAANVRGYSPSLSIALAICLLKSLSYIHKQSEEEV